MFGGDGSAFVAVQAASSTAASDSAGEFTVPAEFLFHGEYKRAGNDLKIIGEHGKAFVVHDYFKTDQLHTLFAPDGAALSGDIVAALTGPLAPGEYAQATPPQNAGEAIGRVATLSGSAVAVRNGVAVALNVGDVVLKGDVVQTQGGSAIGVIFADGSTFDLGANARMVLNEFVYNPAATSGNSSLINLVQGSIVFVAGQVAHTGDMKVGTPSATMGIRGTAVQVDIDVNNGTTQLSVLIEPGGRVGSFNIYSLSGQLLGTANDANGKWTVTPTAQLDAVATVAAKTPAEMAQAFTYVQTAFQTQSIGQTILQQNPLPPSQQNQQNQQNQTPDQNQQNNPQNQNPTQNTPKSQIGSSDVSTTKIAITNTQSADGSANPTPTVTVTPPAAGSPETVPFVPPPPPNPNTPPPPPPVNTQVFFETNSANTSIHVSNAAAPVNQTGALLFTGGDTHSVSVTPHAGNIGSLSATITQDTSSSTAGDIAYTYTAPQGQSPTQPDVFDVTVTDTLSGSAATTSISFVLQNHNPVAMDATYTVTETQFASASSNSQFVLPNVLANVSDPDGDTVTVSAISAPTVSKTGAGLVVLSVKPETAAAGEVARYDIQTNYGDAHVAVGSDGQIYLWSNTGDDPFKGLGVNETATINFNYTVDDGFGGSATAGASITINGANDAAVVAGTASGAVTEAGGVNNGTPGTPTFSGTLTDTDVDNPANTFQAVAAGTASDSGYGSYAMAAGGTWTYTLNNNNAAVQALNVGGTLTDTFTVHTQDGTAQQVTVTINGANDAAVLAGTTSGAVTAAGTLVATGALTDTDVDNPANTFQAVATATASSQGFGSYTVDASGNWSYTLNNNNAAVQALGPSGTLTDTFAVNTQDGTAQTITITISGSDHAPTLAPVTGPTYTDTSAADHFTAATGSLLGSDVDSGTTLTYGISGGSHDVSLSGYDTSKAGSYGTLYVNSTTGAYSFVPSDGAINALPVTTTTDGFTVTVSDGTLSTQQPFAVTLNGANDAAVVAGTASGAVTEAGGVNNGTPGTPTFSGTLTDTDVDNPANTFQAVAAGTASDSGYGSYAMAAGGTWTYTLNNNNAAVQALNVGGTLTDTFTVHTQDGTAQQVTVTINGADDAPVLTLPGTTASVNSGAPLALTGAHVADPDIGDVITLNLSVANGTLVPVDSTLPAGVTVDSGTPSALQVHGSAAAIDQLLNDGVTYTSNNNYVGGDILTVAVHDTAGASDSKQVAITVNSVANQPAVISGTASGAVTEAGGVNNGTPGTPTFSGTLTDTDVDNPANTFQAVAAGTASDSGYGSYAMAAGGTWTYTLNNNNAAVQALNVGGTLTDTFTVHTADGTAQQVTVTINGANDAAVLAGTTSGAVTAAGTLVATGALTDTDVDNPANTFQAVATATASSQGFGSYTVDASGNWSYTLNNNNAAVQALGPSGTLTDTFAVNTQDGTAQTITITISGSDHAPTLAPVTGPTYTDTSAADHFTAATGSLLGSDVDSGTTLTYGISGGSHDVSLSGYDTSKAGSYGTLYVNSTTGAYSFVPSDGAINALPVTTTTDGFTVTVSDGTLSTQQPFAVTLNGANDAAVVAGTASGAVTEAGGVNNGTPGTPTFSGTLTDTDVDNPANTFQAVAAGTASDSGYGSYAMAAGGTWTYTLNNNNAAVQALNVGGTLTDTFTVHTQDGTAQQVTVTINGANDAPVAVNDTNTITAGNGPISGNLLANDSDPENDTLTVTNLINDASSVGTITVDGAYGEVVVAKATGDYTYTLGVTPSEATAVAALAAGAQGQDDFIYTVSDGNGGTANAHLTIAVTGVNDAPVINLTQIISEVPIPNPLPVGTDAAAQQEVAPVISQDGRWVAFFSSEVNPDTNNGNNNSPGDVFLYDRQTGTTTVLTDAAHTASLPSGETFGNGLVSISADGNTVVFRGRQEVADPQSPTGFDQTNQIFIYDRASDTVRILTNPDNNNTPYNVDDTATISGAGNRLVFESFVPSNNGPPTQHVYVTDLNGHVQTDITPAQLGIAQPSDPNQYIAFSSPDINGGGRYLTFWAETRSTGNGTDTPVGQETLYTYDRSNGTSKIIATTTATNNDWPASMSNDGSLVVFQSDVLSGNGQMDIFVWNRNTNTTTDITALANGNSERATISANGHVVIFASDATNLVPGDTNGLGDTFAYDLQTQTFQLLSMAMDGTQGNGDSTLGADLAFGGNGTVFGSTAGNLVVPNDTDNGLSDIFTVDRSAGTIRGVTQGDTTPAFAGAPANSLSVHGAINFADADLTDTHIVQVIGNPTITAPSGFVVPSVGLGTFTPTVVETVGGGGGQVTWTFTVDNALTVGLGALQQVQQVYTVQLSDGHGGVVTQNVTVSIFGINDAPVLTLPGTTASVNSGAPLALTGAHVADPDIGDVITLNLSVANGTLVPVDSTLPAGVTVDSGTPSALQVHGSAAAIDQLLNDGVTYTSNNNYVGGDILTVAVHDTAGASDSKQVAITVNSVANQPAVISGTASGAVTEAGGVNNGTPGTPTFSGTLTDTDVDNPANTFQAVAAGTASDSGYGSYAMAAGGTWTYTLNNNNAAVQALNVGGTLTDTFTVHTADGTAQQVTVTINGANDAAVVAGTASGAVTEAGGVNNGTPGTPTFSGTLTDTDVDNPANTFQAVAAGTASDSGYGSYAMAAGGTWTYTLNNNNAAVQALNVGGTLTDTFTVHTQDGTAQQVTVTINGANDAAVVAGTASGAVTEAGGVNNGTPGTPTFSGTLTDTDVDNPANTFQAVAAGTASDSGYGSYAMAAGGTWTYTLNNNNAAVQALNVGGTLTDTFTVHTQDGTAQQVTVTINGANDAAVVAGTASGAVTEAGGVNNGTPGTPTFSGTLTDTDVDNPANTFQAVAAGTASDSGYGSYAMAAGGTWTYTLNNNNAAVQALNVGGTLTDTFTVHTQDGTAQQVTVTINGANDAAVLAGTTSGAVTAAGTLVATGALTDTDVDNPANTFQAVATATASSQGFGSYTVDASGNWSYTLNNNNAAVQALGPSGTLTDTFAVNTQDGTAQTITITISGSDHAPTLAPVTGPTYTDTSAADHFTAATGSLLGSDVDSGTTLTYGISGGSHDVSLSGYDTSKAGSYGTLYVNSTTGAYSFVPSDGAINALPVTTTTDGFTVTVSDGTLSTQQPFAVTLNGANDAAVVAGTASGAVTEAGGVNNGTPGTPTFSGTLTDTDVDNPANTFQAVAAGTASDSGYGSYAMAAGGTWTYTLNNNNAAVQALNVGGTLTDTFTVHTQDGTAQQVTVTINGADDAPVLTLPGTTASVNSGAPLALTGAHVADPDIGDVITLNLSVANGTLVPIDSTLPAGITVDDGNGADGTLQVHGSAAAVDQLLNDGVTYTPNAGFTGADTLTVAVHDTAGASDSKQIAITVNSVATTEPFTWTTASDGNWSNPSNWNNDSVPGASDQAAIQVTGGSFYTVTIASDQMVDSLSAVAGAHFDITTGALTISGNGDSDIAGGIENSGALYVQSGTLELDGFITNSGLLEATDGGTLVVDNGVDNTNGKIAASGTYSTLTLSGGTVTNGIVTIDATDTLSIEGTSGATLNGVGVTLANGAVAIGSLALDGNGFSNTAAPTTSTSSVTLTTANANDVIILDIVQNGTTVNTVSDTAGLVWHQRAVAGTAPFTIYEYYAIAPTALSADAITVNFAGTPGYVDLNTFGVSGANTLAPFDTNVSLPATPVVSTGSITTSNANDFIFAGYRSNDASSDAGSGWTAINANADYNLAEYQIVSTTQAGLVATTSSVNLTGGIVDAIVQATTTATPGVLTVDAASTLDLNDTTITGGTLINFGATTVTGGAASTLSGVSISNAGATVTVDAGSTLNLNGTTITNGALSNSGMVDSTGISALNVAVTNSGLLEASGGTLTIDPNNVTNTGTLGAKTGGTLKLESISVTNTDGTMKVDASSTLDLNNTTIAGGTLSYSGNVIVIGGATSALNGMSVNASGTGTIGSLALDGNGFSNTAAPTTSTSSVTLTTANANDVIILDIVQNGTTVNTVSDTAGLVWHQRAVAGTAPFTIYEYYAIAPTALLADTITVNFAGTPGYVDLNTFGVSGANTLAPFDTNVSLPATPAVSTGSVTTSNANDVIFAGYRFGSDASPGAGAGWTAINANPDYNLAEYQIVSTTQAGLVATASSTDQTGGIVDAIAQATAPAVTGMLTVNAGSALDLNGTTISGGTLINSGAIVGNGNSAIDNATIVNSGEIETGGTFTLDGDIVNGGVLTGTGAANSSFNVDSGNTLTLNSVTVVAGNSIIAAVNNAGKITLQNALTLGTSPSFSTSTFTLALDGAGTASLNGATIVAAAAMETFENNGNTLSGAGQIGDGTTSNLTFNNNAGTIEALGGTITVETGNTVTNASGATLEATTGATLQINDSVTNNGTLNANGGNLTVVGALAGAGSDTIAAGGTLAIGAADAQIVTYIGSGGTLIANGTVTGGSTSGISATSTDGGALTISGVGNVTSTGADAIDATANAGGDISITANGTVAGALNGISAIENGSGNIAVGGSGKITGQVGYGILAEQSATGLGGVLINGTGDVIGTGSSFDGIFAEILNTNDTADVTVDQTGKVSGGHDGINALTYGNGNVSVTTGANATIAAGAKFGIETESYGSGNVLVTSGIGDQINSASTGIHAENYATDIPQSAGSTITVNAFGSINFGSVVPSGGHPRGVLAWYAGDAAGVGTPNSNVFGDVTVNNYANITQNYDGVGTNAGDGVGALNYGIGNIVVNDGTFDNLGGQGTTINVARFGVYAYNFLYGETTIDMAAGESISAGVTGIWATNGASAILASANSKITVTADGTINSGLNSAAVMALSAGILAGYDGATNGFFSPNLAVTGTVLVNNNANITAAAGWGIDAFNYGNGDVTVHDTALTVSGAQIGIGAYQDSGGTGDVTVTVAAGSTVTGVAGDAIDANNNNGGTGNLSVTAGANATLTGGFHGIVASSIGPGSILISTAAGDVVNAASRGLYAYNDSTAISQAAASTIEVDGYGAINFGSTLTAQGNRPRAIFAGYNGDASASGTPNTNVFGDVTVNNYANLTQTYNGVAADAGDGIAAFNDGIGDITVNDGTLNNLDVQGTSINVARFGIEAINYLSGDILVSMAAGDSITSGSSGIFVNNDATAIDALANSKITITANGTITSGLNSAVNGGSAGILAAYNGAINGPFVPDLTVTGTVLVNNNANITAAVGWGIDAYNYGNGSVTVNDTALAVSGAQTGIGAYQDSGGTGDVVVTVAAGSTVTGVAGDAIDANNNNGGSGNVSVTTGANATITGGYSGIVVGSSGPGSILISTAAGDIVSVASRALWAYNNATAISQSADSTIEVDAYGALNFDSTLTPGGNRPRGIFAGYNGDASNTGTPNANVFGDITVNNYANITQTYNGVSADAGDGIAAFNQGIGDITVTDGTLNNLGGQGTAINVARSGINANNYFSGDTTISMAAGDSVTAGGSGIFAENYASAIDASANSKITITANGTIASGQNSALNGGTAGILAAYTGAINGPFVPDLAVTGTVLVNNNANITAAAGWGIDAYNYGNGSVTVNDTALTVSGAQTGIGAYQDSGGTGDVVVTVAAGSTVSGVAGDAIDANNSGGTGNISVTENGTANGAANGINAIENGSGKITIGGSGNITGQSGYGIFAQQSATGLGGILINGSGNVTGIGGLFDGIHAENDKADDNADVTVNWTGNVSGGKSGIEASTQGNGNLTLTTGANATITGTLLYGIHANEFGAGNVLIRTAIGDQINSASSGIVGNNHNAATSQAPYSTITVNAFGTINSGATPNNSGSRPAGILAGYNGAASGTGTPNANILGDVFVNNYANITAAGGDGIRAFNYGVGSVTVIDGTLNNVNGGLGTTISAPGQYGIDAFNYFAGNILVSTAAGDSVSSGSVGIIATNNSTALPQSANSTITVNAYGTINAGSTLTTGGNRSGGILAAYNGVASGNSAPNANVFGDVLINNYANITGGQTGDSLTTDGIRAGNYGIGNITVVDGTLNNVANGPGTTITATQYGIDAVSFNPGSILISASPGDSISSGSTGIYAYNQATTIDKSFNSTITVNAYGTISAGATLEVGNGVQAGIHAVYSGGSSATINPSVYGDVFVNNYAKIISGGDGIRAGDYGTGGVTVYDGQGSTIQAARYGIYAYDYVAGNISISIASSATVTGNIGVRAELTGTGIVGIINYGTITGVSGQAIAVTLAAGDTATIDNFGIVIGDVAFASTTFNNHSGAVWDVSGSNLFAGSNTIVNDGTINVLGSSSFTAVGVNVSGAGSFVISNGAILEFGGSVAATQTVIFTATTTTETLKVDHSLTAPLSAEISGLTGSPTDAIDLADLTYNAATTTIHYTSLTSTSGTLTVNDGNGHIENFNLISYTGTGNFSVSSDSTHGGTGGTWIVDPPIIDTNPSATISMDSAADTVAISTVGAGSNDAAGLTDSQQVGATNDSGTVQDAAAGTLAGVSSSDLFTVTPAQNNYVGTLTTSGNNGDIDWNFSVPNSGLIQLADKTQVYSVQDQTNPAANQLLSVSVGANDQFQFHIDAGSGAHSMVNFSAATDQTGAYVGETIDLANFTNSQGGGLTLNDVLVDLTTDSHGNAVINLGNGDSVTFEHIAQSTVSAQAAHIFVAHANVV